MKGFLEFAVAAVVVVIAYNLFKNLNGNSSTPNPVVLSQVQNIPPWGSPVPPAWWGRYRLGNGVIQPAGIIGLNDTNTANAQ